jgi:hypothetical protein
MPSGDRTGPLGYGPMTGRGAGYCAGYGAPGYMNPAYGRGRGLGGGRGRRHMYHATGSPLWARGYAPHPAWPGDAGWAFNDEPTPERELEVLKTQSDFFRKQIDTLNKRIRELEEIEAKKSDATS